MSTVKIVGVVGAVGSSVASVAGGIYLIGGNSNNSDSEFDSRAIIDIDLNTVDSSNEVNKMGCVGTIFTGLTNMNPTANTNSK